MKKESMSLRCVTCSIFGATAYCAWVIRKPEKTFGDFPLHNMYP